MTEAVIIIGIRSHSCENPKTTAKPSKLNTVLKIIAFTPNRIPLPSVTHK
ncbi:MAG: hypothetical protein HY308_00875 [Gammaproteobacteria bacterium]|nr:hypothetical protein [Gammaproteobacteria bacterium]